MYSISKSKYCKGVQCLKILWMDEHKPELAEPTASESVLKVGTEVGKLARSYFDGCETVEFHLDKEKMCRDTAELMKKGKTVIAEASLLSQVFFPYFSRNF